MSQLRNTCIVCETVLALGKSGAGLPLHKSEKIENYCSVTAIFFNFNFWRNFSKQDFSSYTLYIYVIAFCP